MSRTVVHVVPHTHWDREWYLPFQSFRLRLVDLVDRVLELADADPRFAFTLDGQLATVDDYLEVRPESEPKIRRLVEEGRLSIGPWQVLMDELLVSGESIVRNLELGLARADELGGAMRVGYLPDMFGHAAQMPQILRRAGIAHAVLWRGVPAAIDRHAFRWEAPDGSAVRVEYLVGGYGNAAHLLAGPERLTERVERFHEAHAPWFGDDPILAMAGTDHSEPLPGLVELAEAVNAAQQRYLLWIGTLARYIEPLDPEAELPRWRGELRSGARANLLMGVVSARIDLKAACARAERLLERYAEPLQALHAARWPEEYLRLAWRRVIENSAHDSICGCSADPVSAQVLVRYAEAEQIAAGLTERAASTVAARAPHGAVVVLNPSPHARQGLVELELEVPDEWDEVALELPDGSLAAAQEVARHEQLLLRQRVRGGDVPEFLRRRLHGRELFGRRLNGYRIEADAEVRRLRLAVGTEEDPPWLDVDEATREIAAAALVAADEPWEIVIEAAPRRRVAALVPAPALGWTSVRAVPGAGSLEAPVEAAARSLANGLVAVEADPDGTLVIEGGRRRLAGVGRLVDGGDAGDSYNYAPPRDDRIVDRPEWVDAEVVAAGPVRGELVVRRLYRWPAGLAPGGTARSAEEVPVEVTTRVALVAGEPFARVRVELENPASDHRLRFHVPLDEPAPRSAAEGQFAVVERPLEAEGGYGEVPLPTFPARGFVAAGGVAVLLDHVLEYELVDGRELVLTLLRATGLISRNANPFREDPAGPEVPIPDAQCRRPWSVGFALYPFGGSWAEADVLGAMERYQHDFAVAPGRAAHAGVRGPEPGLELDGTGVALASLRRRGQELEVRLVCEHPDPVRTTLRGAFSEAREVDLLGRPAGELAVRAGLLELELGPWEIRTLRLR